MRWWVWSKINNLVNVSCDHLFAKPHFSVDASDNELIFNPMVYFVMYFVLHKCYQDLEITKLLELFYVGGRIHWPYCCEMKIKILKRLSEAEFCRDFSATKKDTRK